MRERFSKIFEIPIQDIYTNPKMFQNRNEEFSKSTYEKIIREGFDKSEDPIIVWRDNKKNKYFVIEQKRYKNKAAYQRFRTHKRTIK